MDQVNRGTGPNSSAPTRTYSCEECQHTYSRKDGYDRHLRCLIPCQVWGCENSFRYNKLKEYINHVDTHNARNRLLGELIPRAEIEQYFKATVNELRETYVPCQGGKGKNRVATLTGDQGYQPHTESLVHNSGAWIPGNSPPGNLSIGGAVQNKFAGLAPLVTNDGVASMALEAMDLIASLKGSQAGLPSANAGAGFGHHRIDSISSDDPASIHLSDAPQLVETVRSQVPILQLKISGLEREISFYESMARSKTEAKLELERKLDLFRVGIGDRAAPQKAHALVAIDVSIHSGSEEWIHVDHPNESFSQQEMGYFNTHGEHDYEDDEN